MPEPKPNAADMLDDSWPMSESELQKQKDRPSNQPPPADAPPDPERLTLEQAKERLNSKVQALLSADAKTLQNLVIEIQKLRVVCMLLSESDGDNKTFDPNTYREMSMLNRMLAKGVGGDEDDPNGALEDLRIEEEAADRLSKRGISRDGAARLARVLTSVIDRAKSPVAAAVDDDDEGDEPDMAEEQTH